MKKRAWDWLYRSSLILWASWCGFLLVHALLKREWVGVALMAVVFPWQAYVVYRAFRPRCRHEREQCIEEYGDRTVLSRRIERDPSDPEMLIVHDITIESGKFRCLDCGHIRLYRPNIKAIRKAFSK